MGTLGWLGHVGKDAQTLESNKTKYLAVSPVMDIYEQLDKETDGGSHHANFFNKIWWDNRELGTPGGFLCVHGWNLVLIPGEIQSMVYQGFEKKIVYKR